MYYTQRLAYTALLSATLTCVQAQKHFTITGTVVSKYNESTIRLSSANGGFKPVIAVAKDGQFSFSGKIDHEFEYVFLSVEKNDKKLGGSAFFIRGADMVVQIHSLKDQPTGTNITYTNVPFLKEQAKYDALVKPVEASRVEASKLLFTVEKGIRKGFDKDSLTSVVMELLTLQLKKTIQFVQEFPSAYIALYIFNREVINNKRSHPDSLLHIYSKFDASLKATDLGRSVLARIQIKKALLLSQMAPAFSFLTDKGLHYDLSSFRRHKYVLLCFWASWCGPCKKNIPMLKNLAQTYSTKELQLISVSIDNDQTKWQQALQTYQLPWLQTCDLPVWIKGEQARSLYDIQYIPQYFLIDKDGRVIYQSTQSKDDEEGYSILQQTLANLLK